MNSIIRSNFISGAVLAAVLVAVSVALVPAAANAQWSEDGGCCEYISTSYPEFENVSTSYPEYEYVSTSYPEYDWVSTSYPEYDYVSTSYPEYDYVSTSYPEYDWVSTSYPEYDWVSTSYPEYDYVSTSYPEYDYISTSYPEYDYISTSYPEYDYVSTSYPEYDYVSTSYPLYDIYDTYAYSTPYYSYSYGSTKVTTAPIKTVTSYPPYRPVQQPVYPTYPTPTQKPYCSIQAVPSSISSGQSTVLIWTSSYATSATISNIGSVAVSGQRTVNPTSTTSYTMTVYGQGGSANCYITVGVTGGPIVPPPTPNAPYCTISITPSYNYGSLYSYGYNQMATLTWSSYNATSATISGLGSVSLSGSRTVYPSYNQTYVMTVYGQGGSANCQTNYYQQPTPPVYPPVYPPVIPPIYPPVYPSNLTCSITASPNYIQNGQASVLSWTSSGATTAWLSDGLGNVYPNGSLSVRPESSRTYTLTIGNGYNTQTCQTTLTVSGSYINLTQIPYTGFDLGPVGNALYWLSLMGVAVGAAYLLVYYRGGFGVLALALMPKRAKKTASVQVSESAAPAVVPEKKEFFSGDAMLLAQSKDGSMPRIVISRN